ncbi:trehalase family glycosidase [Cohnella sp. GbtcB17]|uniref:MGH1-like glycoside hydrolase domain-containing protein n=1 Tax=Cohnella sp. GbtcB17 TaxID=2824762 RepID=UPI001C30F335|nr:trehalase family glycosidase [Cohnella sp. GbtcB17]
MSNAPIAILRWCPADDPSGGNRPPSRDNEAWLLPCEGAPRRYEGIVAVPEDGVVLIEWQSPRPLRLWLDGMLVVDEPLYWRSFQREIRGAFVVPCRKGEAVLRAFTGERPSFAPYAAANCPSRNRQKVLDAVQAARPDLIRICGTVHAGVAGIPPVHLRFDPVQHQEGGIVYQRVEAKRLSDPFEPPGTDVRSTLERPPAQIALRSAAVPYETKYAQYASPAHPSAPAKQAPADLAIAHVPVADAVDPLPPARGEDTETRAEPLLEVVRTDALTLRCASAAPSAPGIRVPLPVFESLGRLAPEREYRRLRWPSVQELLAAAPEPVLPAEWAGLGELYADAWRMLLRLVREPAPDSGLPGGYISTGSNFPVNQFLWDTAFTAIAAKYGARALPVHASLDVIYSTQFDGGYIHRELDVRDRQPVLYEPDFGPNPPILTLAEWNLALLTGDILRLKRVYPALKAYHQWIVRNRRQANGTYWTTGLANGLDNSPSYGSGYPCLTAQMAHDAELLGKIAGLIGRGEEAAQWAREYEETRKALNLHLWDPDAHIYAASLDEGGHNPNKIVTAFWPLLAGAVPANRVHDLARHLTDPAAFWRPHPIPSVAADSPHYVPEGDYWRGSVWAPTNYAAIRGFQRAGMTALARQTALKHLNAVLATYRDTGSFWENYGSERFAKGSAAAPEYAWTALGPIALLLETVVGLEPDSTAGELRWSPPPRKAVGAKRYPLGSATIDVTLIDEEDGWHVHVRTDKPFRLRLELPGSDTAYDCRPGHQRWPVAMPEAETAPE